MSVAYDKPCAATEVRGGRCLACYGTPGTTGSRRKCCWLDPANNVHTYQQAQAFRGLVQIPGNTVAGRALRAYQGEADRSINDLVLTEIPVDTFERRLLGQMIVRQQDTTGVSDDKNTNYERLLELTVEVQDLIMAQYQDGGRELLNPVDVIHGILVGMRDAEKTFGKAELLALLTDVDTYTSNVFASEE